MKFIVFLLTLGISAHQLPEMKYSSDVFETSAGELAISFIGHGTLMFEFNDMVIHVDPTMREADYADMPDADLILVTHQ